MLGQLRNSLFDFEALACRRCALFEKGFWADCFRWPEGPAETIQNALSTKKG